MIRPQSILPAVRGPAVGIKTGLLALLATAFAAGTASAQLTPPLGTIVRWDFNDQSLTAQYVDPSVYTGFPNPTAAAVGTVSSSFFSLGTSGGSGNGGDSPTPPMNNYVLRTPTPAGVPQTLYPAQGTGSGTSGVGFNAIRTVTTPPGNAAVRDLMFSFSIRPDALASSWYQLQYSVNGGAFTGYANPFQYRFQGSSGTQWSENNYISLASVSALEGQTNVAFRVVSVFAPVQVGVNPPNTVYQPTAGTYNTAALVDFDLVTVGQANRLMPVSGTIDVTDASKWSLGQISTGDYTSNLSLGAQSGPVTIDNPGGGFNAQSITFRDDDTTPYTFTSGFGGYTFGRNVSNINYLAELVTLINASNQAHQFNTRVELSYNQVWSSGPTVRSGSKITFNDFILFNSSLNLTIAGENTIAVSSTGGLDATIAGSATITKTGGGTLVLDADSSKNRTGLFFTGVNNLTNYVVNGGTLQVSNAFPNGNESATGEGTVTVNSGGTVRGTGRIAPSSATGVTINAGGIIMGGTPANPTGTTNALNVSGNVSIKGAAGTTGGALGVNLGGTNPNSNPVSFLNVTASTIGGGTNGLNFDVRNGPVKIKLLNDSGLVYNNPYSFQIAQANAFTRTNVANGTTSVTSYAFGTEFVLESSFPTYSGPSPGFVPKLEASGGFLTLSFTPTPEPAHALAAGTAVLGLTGWLRRRRAAVA